MYSLRDRRSKRYPGLTLASPCISKIRRGISLLEVMVAVGIISILLSLFLPAVQKSREAARSISCRSQLHQVGLAAHNFHDVHKKLPGGMRPLFDLLPHVEADGLQRSLTNVVNGDGSPVYVSELPPGPAVYVCPADSIAASARRELSYLINEGTSFNLMNGARAEIPSGSLRYGDFSDGTSNTAFFSERLVGYFSAGFPISSPEFTKHQLRYFPLTTLRHYAYGEELEFGRACMSGQVRRSLVSGAWGLPVLWSQEARYNHLVPPNRAGCQNASLVDESPDARQSAAPATSLHNKVVHVLMADGSVRSVSENVDFAVWRAVGSRSGNEADYSF